MASSILRNKYYRDVRVSTVGIAAVVMQKISSRW